MNWNIAYDLMFSDNVFLYFKESVLKRKKKKGGSKQYILILVWQIVIFFCQHHLYLYSILIGSFASSIHGTYVFIIGLVGILKKKCLGEG